MFQKPHHRVPGENFLTNLFLPAFRSQNAEVELVLGLESAQRELQKHQHRHRDSMAHHRERQVVSINQKRDGGSFLWQRKWLRQDANRLDKHQDGRRPGESDAHYLDRRVRELTHNGDVYRAEMRYIKDDLRRATGEIAELKVELRRVLSMGVGGGVGGLGLGGGVGGGVGGLGSERGRYSDDGRPLNNIDQQGRNWAGGQHYGPSPLERNFPWEK